jgi:hypothetical protein
MPDLAAELGERFDEALKLAEIGEDARLEATRGSRTRVNLHPSRLEALYELAYLRVFVGWEAFLEQAFLRYLCGYLSTRGAATLIAGATYAPTLASAEKALLGGNRYALWHNPAGVVKRCQKFFSASPIEAVVNSNLARLTDFAAVRHRITHAHGDTRKNFDVATMNFAGGRYRGGRPGAFLRDRDTSHMPQIRWLERLTNELGGLAAQIV